MEQAEKADTTESDDQSLPHEIARRETLKAKMGKAIVELEARAAKRQKRAQQDYDKKKKVRTKNKDNGKPLGRLPKPPGSIQEIAAANTEKCNLCLLYTSPSPRDQRGSRMPSSA